MNARETETREHGSLTEVLSIRRARCSEASNSVRRTGSGRAELDLASGCGGGPRRRPRPSAASCGRWTAASAASGARATTPRSPSGPGARTASSRGAQSKPSPRPARSAWEAARPRRGPRKSRCLKSAEVVMADRLTGQPPLFLT